MIIPIEVIFWKASHRSDKTCIYYIQRKFCSSKTSELRTNVQGQSCHHVNHIVSKSSLRVRAAEKSNSSGTREFTGERQTLCFFGGCVPWVSLFPQVRASICKGGRQKVHRTVARAGCHIKMKIERVGTLLEDEVRKFHCFIGTFIQTFIASFVHSCIHCFTHSFTCSLMYTTQFNSTQFV